MACDPRLPPPNVPSTAAQTAAASARAQPSAAPPLRPPSAAHEYAKVAAARTAAVTTPAAAAPTAAPASAATMHLRLCSKRRCVHATASTERPQIKRGGVRLARRSSCRLINKRAAFFLAPLRERELLAARRHNNLRAAGRRQISAGFEATGFVNKLGCCERTPAWAGMSVCAAQTAHRAGHL